MIGFIIWVIVSCLFIGIGISSFRSKKAMGFWANMEMFEVTDVRKYNHAVGKMWIVFGVVMLVLGLPLLAGQNSPIALLSAVGMMMEIIFLMIFYVMVIEKKYRKK